MEAHVIELQKSEMVTISGGSGLRMLYRGARYLLTLGSGHDAIQNFREGWNACGTDC